MGKLDPEIENTLLRCYEEAYADGIHSRAPHYATPNGSQWTRAAIAAIEAYGRRCAARGMAIHANDECEETVGDYHDTLSARRTAHSELYGGPDGD